MCLRSYRGILCVRLPLVATRLSQQTPSRGQWILDNTPEPRDLGSEHILSQERTSHDYPSELLESSLIFMTDARASSCLCLHSTLPALTNRNGNVIIPIFLSGIGNPPIHILMTRSFREVAVYGNNPRKGRGPAFPGYSLRSTRTAPGQPFSFIQ